MKEEDIMKRRQFLTTVGAAAGLALEGKCHAADSKSSRKPNIVLINADDLGIIEFPVGEFVWGGMADDLVG
jgi:hypothetical protein